MRHRWAVAGVREVPWQSAPITVRVCSRCGCEKTREPFGAHFGAVYKLGGVVTNYAPECPGEGPKDEQAEGNLEADL